MLSTASLHAFTDFFMLILCHYSFSHSIFLFQINSNFFLLRSRLFRYSVHLQSPQHMLYAHLSTLRSSLKQRSATNARNTRFVSTPQATENHQTISDPFFRNADPISLVFETIFDYRSATVSFTFTRPTWLIVPCHLITRAVEEGTSYQSVRQFLRSTSS